MTRTKATGRAIHAFTKTHLEMEQAVSCDYQGQYICRKAACILKVFMVTLFPVTLFPVYIYAAIYTTKEI